MKKADLFFAIGLVLLAAGLFYCGQHFQDERDPQGYTLEAQEEWYKNHFKEVGR